MAKVLTHRCKTHVSMVQVLFLGCKKWHKHSHLCCKQWCMRWHKGLHKYLHPCAREESSTHAWAQETVQTLMPMCKKWCKYSCLDAKVGTGNHAPISGCKRWYKYCHHGTKDATSTHAWAQDAVFECQHGL